MTNPDLQVSPAQPQNTPQNIPDKTLQDLVDLLDAAYKTYQESLPPTHTLNVSRILTQIQTQAQTQTNAPGTQFSQALVNINILDNAPDMDIWNQWVASAVANNDIRLTTMFKPASAGSMLLVAMPYAVWLRLPQGDANFTFIHGFS